MSKGKIILTDGDGMYSVTCATVYTKIYEVFPDVGLCPCLAGVQGAFCKHQALVHKTVWGAFPNAPVLTPWECRNQRLAGGGGMCQQWASMQTFRNFQRICRTRLTTLIMRPLSKKAWMLSHRRRASRPISITRKPSRGCPYYSCLCIVQMTPCLQAQYFANSMECGFR